MDTAFLFDEFIEKAQTYSTLQKGRTPSPSSLGIGPLLNFSLHHGRVNVQTSHSGDIKRLFP